jgi:hypothetical protein
MQVCVFRRQAFSVAVRKALALALSIPAGEEREILGKMAAAERRRLADTRRGSYLECEGMPVKGRRVEKRTDRTLLSAPPLAQPVAVP